MSAEPALPVSQPEEDTRKCQDCGRDNPVWFAENEVWNAVFPERVGFVCPNCFIKRADPVVHNTGWKLVPDVEPATPSTPQSQIKRLIAEWERFYTALPDGEYGGLGALRLGFSLLKQSLAGVEPPTPKEAK